MRQQAPWDRRTKPGKSFFGFLFPLRPAKTLGGGGVPAGRFRVRADLSWICASSKATMHRVCVRTTPQADLGDPRWFVPCGIRALNLSPIAH